MSQDQNDKQTFHNQSGFQQQTDFKIDWNYEKQNITKKLQEQKPDQEQFSNSSSFIQKQILSQKENLLSAPSQEIDKRQCQVPSQNFTNQAEIQIEKNRNVQDEIFIKKRFKDIEVRLRKAEKKTVIRFASAIVLCLVLIFLIVHFYFYPVKQFILKKDLDLREKVENEFKSIPQINYGVNSHFQERGAVNIDYINKQSIVQIQIDPYNYDFKTIDNIKISAWTGNYTGMVNITSGLPSGFGRFIGKSFIIDGQFHEGQFHGMIRYIDSDSYWISNWKNGVRNGKDAQWYRNGKLRLQGEYKNWKFTGKYVYYDQRGIPSAYDYIDDILQ